MSNEPKYIGADSSKVRRLQGQLVSGGQYLIDVPLKWNGTLFVFSPGFGFKLDPQPRNSGDEVSKSWLLEFGYALATYQPNIAGWNLEELLPGQIAMVELFQKEVGQPKLKICWGYSMGGLASAGLVERYPDTFDGGVLFCGSVAGGLGMLNQGFDAAFAIKTLLAPDIKLKNFSNLEEEQANSKKVKTILDQAQQTAAGRARIGLAASFAQLSTWSVPGTAKPARNDWEAQQQQQVEAIMFAVFSPRRPLEARAGGNISWNSGIDYRNQLANSGKADLVQALYAQAGIDLEADLDKLANAPRIAPEPKAVAYMERNFTPNGDIKVPVITLHEIGDNAPVVTQASAYREAVKVKGCDDLLRQAFVDRPGHCGYAPAEVLAILLTLEQRLLTGEWHNSTTATELNALATRLVANSSQRLGKAEFVNFQPGPFLRPYFPEVARV